MGNLLAITALMSHGGPTSLYGTTTTNTTPSHLEHSYLRFASSFQLMLRSRPRRPVDAAPKHCRLPRREAFCGKRTKSRQTNADHAAAELADGPAGHGHGVEGKIWVVS